MANVDIGGNSKAAQEQRTRNTAKVKEAKIRQYVLEVDVEELLTNCRMGVKAKG